MYYISTLLYRVLLSMDKDTDKSMDTSNKQKYKLIMFNDIGCDGLTDTTKYMYTTKMDKLCTFSKKSYEWIMLHPKTIIELIRKIYPPKLQQ